MKSKWKAASAAALLCGVLGLTSCGDVYRPIANVISYQPGQPSSIDSVAVLNSNPNGYSSVSNINVSGDTNAGNRPVGRAASAIAYDGSRSFVFSANTPDNTVSIVTVSSSGSLSTAVATLSLSPGSTPINFALIPFGNNYTTEYVVNSKPNGDCPNGGSIGAITIGTQVLKGDACVGVDPVYAVIYANQTKVFVLDRTESVVYVVGADTLQAKNKIAVGSGPIKAATSSNGNYIYVLNQNDATISIISGETETVVGTVSSGGLSPNDIVLDSKMNRIWVLNSGDNTVSVFDASTPGALTAVRSGIAVGGKATNLTIQQNGGAAYVGLAGTAQMTVIDGSSFATRNITVAQPTTVNLDASTTRVDTPVVTWVQASRDNSRVYAGITTTSFIKSTSSDSKYFGQFGSGVTTQDLTNGTVSISTTGYTVQTTLPAPQQDLSCVPTNDPVSYQECPLQRPTMLIGR